MNKNIMYYFFILTLFFFGINTGIFAQNFMISQVYRANADSNSIYSVVIRNTSNDSIMVLHTQEAELPPFINEYKWENGGVKGKLVTLYLGKSNNPFLPEKYRATKTLAPKGVLELYFSLPAFLSGRPKELLVYYSMLHEKYYGIFNSLETKGTTASFKKCRVLKEKKGVVHNRKVSF